MVPAAIPTSGLWVVQAAQAAQAETRTFDPWAAQVVQVVQVVLVLVECHRVEILTLVQEALVREETQEIYLATHCNSKARASEQISEETTATQQICMCSATTRN